LTILDKARGGQNLLERIMNFIPGFSGYRDRDLRRDADKLQREHLANKLDETKRALNDIAMAATREGNLDAINDVETVRKRLDAVIARLRWADRGYSGFFDDVKVDEAMLDRAYQADLALLENVARVRQSAQASTPAAQRLQAMQAELQAIDQALTERDHVLGGFK
jgi:hypothetical protein